MIETHMMNVIKQDWAANQGNARSRAIVVLFRAAQGFVRSNILSKLLLFPVYLVYRFVVQIFVGFDVPAQTRIGEGLRVFHCHGIVINPGAVIGSNCTLRHTTTIGNKDDSGGLPSIGDWVDIGCHTVILGDISIADHTTIGAGSVVLSDSSPHSVMVGVPARVANKDE